MDSFINSLSNLKTPGNIFNPYYGKSKNNLTRKNNLKIYLNLMLKIKPTLLLIGEAIGYQGARLTGVPLTSEHLMINGIKNIPILGEHLGYQKTDEFPDQKKEHTATIVWNTINNLNIIPLFWNALPFHPHRQDNPWSNRTPTNKEIELGHKYLNTLINIFNINHLIAMGNHAEKLLIQMNIHQYFKVRHPAHGGKQFFINGICQIINQISNIKK